MEKPVAFQDLATHLHTLLESESYSKTTMKDMEFVLDSFTAYMVGIVWMNIPRKLESVLLNIAEQISKSAHPELPGQG